MINSGGGSNPGKPKTPAEVAADFAKQFGTGTEDENGLPVFRDQFALSVPILDDPNKFIDINYDVIPQDKVSGILNYSIQMAEAIGHVENINAIEEFRARKWYELSYQAPNGAVTYVVMPVEETLDRRGFDSFRELSAALAVNYLNFDKQLEEYSGVELDPEGATTIVLMPSSASAGGLYDRKNGEIITAPRPPAGAIMQDESARRAVSVCVHEKTHQLCGYSTRPNLVQFSEGIPLLFQELLVDDRSPQSFPLIDQESLDRLGRNARKVSFRDFEISTIAYTLIPYIGDALDVPDILYLSGYAVARGFFRYLTGVNIANYKTIDRAMTSKDIQQFLNTWVELNEFAKQNEDKNFSRVMYGFITKLEREKSRTNSSLYPENEARARADAAMVSILIDVKDVMVGGFIQEAGRVKLAQTAEAVRRTNAGL